MATAHLCVHERVSRGKGGSIVATAAYNARCRLVDEQTGEVHDYRHLGETLAGGTYAKNAPEWVNDLQRLVNEVERAERRSDAQLAINLDIAMPHELSLEQNQRLGQDFVRESFMRSGYVARMDIHPPDLMGDNRNIHMHVWATLRKIGPEGFARTKGEQQENFRNRRDYVEQLRQRWEKLANRHLERAGVDARIDMRSFEDRGIEREPEQHRGPTVTAMMRDKKSSRVADDHSRRQNEAAEDRALNAEIEQLAATDKKIDAQIIDLEAKRAERLAREAAKGLVDDIRPEKSSLELASSEPARSADIASNSDAGPGNARPQSEPSLAERFGRSAPQQAVERDETPGGASVPGNSNTRATEPQRETERGFSRSHGDDGEDAAAAKRRKKKLWADAREEIEQSIRDRERDRGYER